LLISQIAIMSNSIVFISSMDSVSWGGSEELWSRAALNLASQGFEVAASVIEWSPLHPRVLQLRDAGILLSTRPRVPSIWESAWGRIFGLRQSAAAASAEKLIRDRRPDLVVFSSGTAFPFVDLVEICRSRSVPFVTIGQANHDGWWLDDNLAQRLRPAMLAASRCYFVSEANLALAERQLGCRLPNAEIVRNPFNVDYNVALAWPRLGTPELVRLACVGRLHPGSKGQDILFQVLALPTWLGRNWVLTLYGEGPMREGLERLAHLLGIADRVVFASHVSDVERIWENNHVLIMPSRFEGLPLSIVEAMLCARPVVATNVAGHAEIIQDGVTGFLAEAPNPNSLNLALQQFWARRDQAEEMGKLAARRIRELVPSNPAIAFTEKILDLLNSLKQAG
jgi:glycosyltransferase involved in cell wall biosynthesis